MAMRADSELKVITKAKDLISYLFQISENAPKKFRFTLISKMQNSALNVLEYLILANEIMLGSAEDNKTRKDYQHKAIANLKVLDALAMSARQVNCILPKQYEVLSRHISDCVKLTGAWINSDKKRSDNMGMQL